LDDRLLFSDFCLDIFVVLGSHMTSMGTSSLFVGGDCCMPIAWARVSSYFSGRFR
jgi:hypothetical protein